MRRHRRDDHALRGLEQTALPLCVYRTPVGRGRFIFCRQPRVRGYPFNIVPPQTCLRCTWNISTIEPRKLPSAMRLWCLLALRHGRRAFQWGTLLRRAIKAVSFGAVRPRSGCGCHRRAKALDEAGGRVMHRIRTLLRQG